MGKAKDLLNTVKDKLKSLTMVQKVAGALVGLIVVIAIIVVVARVSKPEYEVLYRELSAEDTKTVVDQLEEQKVPYQINSNGVIEVKKGSAPTLQAKIDPSINTGIKGLSIFDESDLLGKSSEEFNVKYQEAVQGEIEKTLNMLPQVSESKVTVVLPEKNAFVSKDEKASMSIFVTTTEENGLSNQQVKSIISSVTKMVRNLAPEDVSIVDQTGTDLAEAVRNGNLENGTWTPDKQAKSKSKVEQDLKAKIDDALKTMLGEGRYTTAVNVVQDFDEKKTEEVTTPKNPNQVSRETVKENGGNENVASGSPIDDNTDSNNYDDNGNTNYSKESETVNYDTQAHTTTFTNQVPGKTIDTTISISIDNPNLSRAEVQNYMDFLVNAAGITDTTKVTVMGMEFNPEAKQAAIDSEAAQKEAATKEALSKVYTMLAFGVGGLLLSVLFFVIMRDRRREEDEEFEEEFEPAGIDMMIGDDGSVVKTIDFEEETEEQKIEEQIKKYATEKPEQVAEIVKSWLVGDEVEL